MISGWRRGGGQKSRKLKVAMRYIISAMVAIYAAAAVIKEVHGFNKTSDHRNNTIEN